MILSSTLAATKHQIKLVSVFIHCPIYLSPNLFFKVSATPRNSSWTIFKTPALLCLLTYSTFLLFNGAFHLGQPGIDVTTRAVICQFSFGVLPVVVTLLFSWYRKPEDFVSLLKMFLRFERTLWGKQCPAEFRKLGRYLSYSLWVLVFEGSIAAALLVFVIILVQRIPFLGSLIPEMHGLLSNYLIR